MSKIRHIFLFIILVFLTANFSDAFSIKKEYSKYWFKFYSLATKNRVEEANKVINEFFKEPYQYNKREEIVSLIWNYSLQTIKNGNLDAGKNYLYTLSKYENNWKIFDDLSKIELKSLNILKGIKNAFVALKLFIYSDDNILILSPLAKSIFWGLFLSFVVFLLFKYSYNFEVLLNDLNLNLKIVQYISLVVFALISTVFVTGAFYIPFGIGAVIFFYLQKKEKKLLFLYVFLFLFSFIALLYTNIIQTASYNKNYKAIIKIKEGKYTDQELLKIEKELEKDPDPQLFLTIAIRYYNDNLLFDSKRVLEKVKESEKYNKLKYFYLGNIYYKVGFFSKAKDMYFKALQFAPNDPYLNFNVSVLLFKINQPDLAQKYALIAQKAGIKREGEIITKNDPLNINIFPYVNFNFSKEMLFHPIFLGLLIFFVLLILLKIIFRSIGSSIRCASCGKPTKKNRNSVNDRYCEECFNLFIIREPFLSETRKIKYKEIEENNLKMTKKILILSILFPGIDLIYRELSYLYFILSFFTFFSLVLFFTLNVDLIVLKASNILSFNTIFLWLALLFYIITNIISYFVEKKEWL